MSKPIIGITGSLGTAQEDKQPNARVMANRLYVDCLVEAGGTPVVLTPQSDPTEVASLIDGWLIPGGDDIDASYFGEENHPKAEHEGRERVDFEFALWKAMDPAMPVLGICYGCQFIDVARGGTLVQHLPDVVGNDDHSGGTRQRFHVEPGSLLESVVGEREIEGKSYHHQAVRTPGEGLRVVARHEDGTVEGVEDATGRWILGVQWHPERTADERPSQSIFAAFVAEAARRSAGRRDRK